MNPVVSFLLNCLSPAYFTRDQPSSGRTSHYTNRHLIHKLDIMWKLLQIYRGIVM